MSKIIPLGTGRAAAAGFFDPLWIFISKTHALMETWRTRRRRRAELRRLLRAGPHLIADIGLDDGEALAEIRKAPWQA